jgi:2-iminobutanoate/2-iminopropanoate deaminase
MTIERFEPDGIAKPTGIWSTVVTAKPGRLAFFSGFISIDADGKPVGIGDMRAQTRRVCEQLQIAVKSLGASMSDVVRVDLYTKDISQFAAIHEVRREFFPDNMPASTMVEVTRLVGEHSLIEMNAIAVVPG